MRATTREARRERLLETRAYLVALLEPLSDYDRLGEIVVGQRDVDRQIEADRTLSNIGREAHDVGVGGEDLVELRCNVVARGQHRGIVLQREVHQEFRRSEEGKNCSGMKRIPQSATAKRASVTGIVIHLPRIAVSRQRRNTRIGALSVSPCTPFGGRSSEMPTTGAQTPETSQDVSSASATTANSENMYSPEGQLRANPTGTNAAIVTSVPVSRGMAVDGVSEDGSLRFVVAALQPEDHAFDGDHGIVHQQAERDDESSERDALKVDAQGVHCGKHHHQRQAEMEPTTIAPARRPRLRMLTPRTMAMDSHSASMNS